MLCEQLAASSIHPQRLPRIAPSRVRRASRAHRAVLSTRAALVAALASWVCLAHAQAPQGGSMKTDDTLRMEPSPTSAAVATAAKNSRVELLERKGFWMRSKSGGAAGWVKLTAGASAARERGRFRIWRAAARARATSSARAVRAGCRRLI
jgi:hypothetical protein